MQKYVFFYGNDLTSNNTALLTNDAIYPPFTIKFQGTEKFKIIESLNREINNIKKTDIRPPNNNGYITNYSVGLDVEVRYNGRFNWIRGKIIRVNSNGTVNVRFDSTKESYNPKMYNYLCNSIGSTIGFSEKDFTNEIEVTYSVANPGTLTIICNTVDDLTILEYCILNINPALKMFKIDNNSIIDFNDTNNYVMDINYKNKTVKMKTNLSTINLTTASIRFTFVIGDNVANFDKDKFLLLQIDEFDRFDSTDKSIQNSFALIPMSDSIKYFENTKNYGNLKCFCPRLSKLGKLNISFKKYNGKLYDFNGKDHCLIFAVNYNTNISY